MMLWPDYHRTYAAFLSLNKNLSTQMTFYIEPLAKLSCAICCAAPFTCWERFFREGSLLG
jgi:hypothetical protein